MFIHNFLEIGPVVADLFQSGPKRWTDWKTLNTPDLCLNSDTSISTLIHCVQCVLSGVLPQYLQGCVLNSSTAVVQLLEILAAFWKPTLDYQNINIKHIFNLDLYII